MKVWIVRGACFTSEASALAYAAWNPGATVRQVDIVALERVAEAAREWRDVRTRPCPQSMERVEEHWRRTQEKVAEVDDALDALDAEREER